MHKNIDTIIRMNTKVRFGNLVLVRSGNVISLVPNPTAVGRAHDSRLQPVAYLIDSPAKLHSPIPVLTHHNVD